MNLPPRSSPPGLGQRLPLWRRLVLRIVDPASEYMAHESSKRQETRGAGIRPSGHVGPVRASGRVLSDPAGQRLEDTLAAIDELLKRQGAELRAASESIVRGKTVTLHTNDGSVEARLVRFWRGDSVLELTRTDTTSRSIGGSRTRITKDGDETIDDISVHLAHSVMAISPDGRLRP